MTVLAGRSFDGYSKALHLQLTAPRIPFASTMSALSNASVMSSLASEGVMGDSDAAPVPAVVASVAVLAGSVYALRRMRARS